MKLRSRAGALLVAVLTLGPVSSRASADVVVGNVNPVTGQTTLFTDLLKTTFSDGGPIRHLYVAHRAGADTSNGFFLVRAGKLQTGECHTEIIDLETEGTRLTLTAIPVLRFSCEEGPDGCGGGVYPAFCMPNDAVTQCACRPGFAAGNGGPDKCQKVFEFWPIHLFDLLWATGGDGTETE